MAILRCTSASWLSYDGSPLEHHSNKPFREPCPGSTGLHNDIYQRLESGCGDTYVKAGFSLLSAFLQSQILQVAISYDEHSSNAGIPSVGDVQITRLSLLCKTGVWYVLLHRCYFSATNMWYITLGFPLPGRCVEFGGYRFARVVSWGSRDLIMMDASSGPGPCLTTATWRCCNNLSQGEPSFLSKLRCHWLKGLWQHQIAVVRQGPALARNYICPRK